MFVGSESHYQFCTKSEDCAQDGYCGGVPLFQICLPYRKEGQSCLLLTCAPGLTCSFFFCRAPILDSGSSST
ncbi:hypothetical protein JTE90_012836 [Oedothorax gibbosus]|uniref:Dickkopf N-terminal cysteine-rich domain-containing protein n=1 Tax=Oedothorax gibbosus TaxID=931172 RepID=A0AAV6TNJ1_9ARAC|nr:hypothetical protein JTE90_012836 [Oedothorax gibbosus]